MALYRSDPKDGVAWITGASSGIGRALAKSLVAQGYVVAATARDAGQLDVLSAEAASEGKHIVGFPADVTDRQAMSQTVESIEAKLGPIALAVFNAGTYLPVDGARLDIDRFRKTYEVNVFGVVNGLAPVVERMKARGKGQIVITGSVSSYAGLPSAAAYGASKAAVNLMAESLKHDFDAMNIRIQVVNPGFIDTPLTEKNDFPMPSLMPVDKAAERMAEGIRSGGFEVTFPRRFTWRVKLLKVMPLWLRYRLIHKATGWDKRPGPG